MIPELPFKLIVKIAGYNFDTFMVMIKAIPLLASYAAENKDYYLNKFSVQSEIFTHLDTITYTALPNGLKHGSYSKRCWVFPKPHIIETTYYCGKLEGSYKYYLYLGPSISYFPLIKSYYYKNGLKNGLCKKFNIKGIIEKECEYIAGIKNGICKIYNNNGSIRDKYTLS